MPRFEPFAGLRYDPDRVQVADVVAPPYDVIAPDERDSLKALSPYNSVRIELPDVEPGLDAYQAAAERVAGWQDKGILRRDVTPALYGYRMTYSDETGRQRQTIGVIGALGLEPPGTAGIFPHERTTPKAKSDRLQLLEATEINTSPIWVLSLAQGLSDALGTPDPLTSAVVIDPEGIKHELWPITDPDAIAAITDAVAAAPVVIADGHHRFETALTYQRQRKAAGAVANAPGAYDSVMALVVELADQQLSVQGIHRLLDGLPAGFDLVEALSHHFALTAATAATTAATTDARILDLMEQTESMALLTASGTWLLHPTPETSAAAGQDLDSARLEIALAELPEHEITYQHGWDLARDAVTSGAAQAAVLLRPVTVEQIASTGRGGERMPPKSTFFWPKPRTGFVFREVPG